MTFNKIHCCLDCGYAGALYHYAGKSQCPQCASRAVWPVSAWVKPDWMKLPFHQSPAVKQLACCEMTPAFLGGPDDY
jgi:hypothetical protein